MSVLETLSACSQARVRIEIVALVEATHGRRDWVKLLAGAGLTLGCRARDSSTTSLWLAGDLHFGESPPRASPFLAALPGAGVVNLEGPLTAGPGWIRTQGGVLLRNLPGAVSWMKDAGIQSISMMNNHAQDWGSLVHERSQALLADHGIQCARKASLTQGHSRSPWTVLGAFVGARKEIGLQPEDLAAIQRLDARGHKVVVSMHIDAPPSHLPSPRVRAGVNNLVDAGARVVVLHGSHVIGPIQRHARGLIVWGLGNLSFACPCSQERDGLILLLSQDRPDTIRARVYPILTGNSHREVQAAKNPHEIFELLRALQSSPMSIRGEFAEF